MRSRDSIIKALLAHARGSTESSLLISGADGAGKSWLLQQLSMQLASEPHVLLRASPVESQWPLSGVMTLLSTLNLAGSSILGDFLPKDPADPVDEYAVARALQTSILDKLTPGTAILMDDADLMDGPSQRVISYLANKLHHTRSKLIATVSSLPLPEPFAAMNTIKLPELTRAECMQIARAHAGREADSSVLAIVVTHAQGCPGIIINHLDALNNGALCGSSPLRFPLRSAVDRDKLILQKMRSLSDSQKHLVRIAAMAPLVERKALLATNEVASADLDTLVQDGLLTSQGAFMQLSDPLLRSAIYWNTNSGERRELHEIVHRYTADQHLSRFHLSFIDSEQVSAAQLLDGARLLLLHHEPDMVIELAERALHLATDGSDVSKALAYLSADLLRQLELETAQRYIAMALGMAPTPSTLLELHTINVQINSLSKKAIPGAEISALVNQHAAPDPVACAQLLSTVATAHCLREEPDQARSYLERAASLLDGSQTAQLSYRQAQVLLAALEQEHATVLAAHSEVTRSSNGSIAAEFHVGLAIALMTISQHREAREILQLIAPTPKRPNLLLARLVLLLSAANAIQNENVPRALNLVEQWMSTDGPPLLEPVPQLIQAWYWMNKGRTELVRPLIDAMEPHAMPEISAMTLSKVADLNGGYALMRGEYNSAAESFRRALYIHEGPCDQRYVRTAANLVEALVSLGRFEEASNEYRNRQAQMAAVPGRRSKLLLRRAQALALPGDLSLHRFHTLLQDWTPADSSFELARIRHCYGERLLFLGMFDLAREQLQSARSLYSSLGAKGWVQNLDGVLANGRNRHLQVVGPVELTHSEYEVVRMLHGGMTNKAIAKELYISVSAVEARLTKLYRRTGAKNRQQLASRFTELNPPTHH